MRRFVHLSYDLLATVSLFLLSVVFFQRAIFNGEIFVERDTRVFYYPLHAWFADRLQHFQFPLWSPEYSGGFPIFADGETGMFYPPNVLLSFFLPGNQAFIWNLVLHFFFAGIFMYCFIRALGQTRLAGVLGGATFMLSGFLVAQVHHQNLIDSAVWLPLILCFIERAARSTGGRRHMNLAFAGAAYGFQALSVHVQVPLMSSLVIGAYATFRWLLCPVAGGPPRLRIGHTEWQQGWIVRLTREELDRLWAAARVVLGRIFLWGWTLAIIPLVGGGLAAVQLLPLYELGTFSRRAGGVNYAFATLHPQTFYNFATLLFPNFYEMANGYYWGLWSAWETRVYVGLVPLVLAIFALVACRSRFVYFFAALGVTALWIGMASDAPFFNLHAWLFQFPGFNQMRAPGRYSLVWTMSVALLTAYGFSFLETHLRSGLVVRPGGPGPLVSFAGTPPGRWRVPLYAGLALVFIAALELVLRLETMSAQVAARSPEVVEWITNYLKETRMTRLPDEALNPDRVYAGLQAALNPNGFWMNYTLVLIFLAVLILFLWLAFRPLRRVWQAALILLVVVDLTFIGWQFHPSAPMSSLDAATPPIRFLQSEMAANPGRIYSKPGAVTAPNSLVPFNLPEIGGYSSLNFTRHEEYTGALESGYPHLLDAFDVRYVVASNRYVPLPSYESTPFNPNWPLISAVSTANGSASIGFNVDNFTATDLRIVSHLRNSYMLPQGTPVVEVKLTDDRGQVQTFQLKAGIDTAEWAIDRPDVQAQAKHRKAKVGFEFKTLAGVVEKLSFYTDLPFGSRKRITRVDIRDISPIGDVQVLGATLVDEPTRALRHLTVDSADRWVRAYEDADVVIYENKNALPRAYLAPNAIVRSAPKGQPSIEILNYMAENAFDPRREVVFDATDAPPSALQQRPAVPAPSGSAIRWLQDEDDDLTLQVTTPISQYLVLADSYYPGWNATIDGKPATIYRANYLFRGLEIPPGDHVVSFRFQPASFWTGFRITLGMAVGLIAVWAIWRLGGFALLLAALARRWHRRGGHWRTFPSPRRGPAREPDWGLPDLQPGAALLQHTDSEQLGAT